MRLATMRDQNKLDIATARLKSFVSNLPRSPDEDHVLQYHDIIKFFEEACEQDLSQFRIAPDRVKPEADSTTKASYRWYWQTRRPKKNFVEFAYFRDQVRGLIAYLMTAVGSRPY
jgi:hypothetical protein